MANYSVIRHYHFKLEDSEEIDKIVRDSFIPIIKNCKGFVSYYWLDGGNGEAASISIFETKAEADNSTSVAAEFVKSQLKDFFVQKPEIIEGLIVAQV